MGIKITVHIQKDPDGEYRVPCPKCTEAGAYYTDDHQDALATAKIIWKGARDVSFKVVRVKEHRNC